MHKVHCGRAVKPDTTWSWLVCFAGAVCNALHFGFSQSFGVFLPILADHFKENRERTAWAGSIALAFTLFASPIAVWLSHRFGHRLVSIAAGFTCALSLLVSSFVNNLTVLYFSYGVLFGMGGGLILNNSITIIFKYFKNESRSLAIGIVAAGISLGVMVLGPILEVLIEALQWRGALRLMAGVMLLVCVLSSTYRPVIEEEEQSFTINKNQAEVQEPRGGKCSIVVQYLSVFKSIRYSVGATAVALTYFGLFVPNIHLVRFAKDLSISSRNASFLFTAIGVSSTLARVLFGIILDRKWLTPLHSLQVSSLVIGLSLILSTLSKEYSHLVVFAVAYGFGNGIFVTSHVVFLQSIVEPRLSAIGLAMGSLVSSIVVCGGAPFVGFIADETGSYILSFYVVGGIVLFAAVFPFVLCCAIRKKETQETKIEVELECAPSAYENEAVDHDDVKMKQCTTGFPVDEEVGCITELSGSVRRLTM